MPDRATRYQSHPVTVVVLVAFALFAMWQLTYHWVFMVLIPVRGMVAFHLTSLAAETAFAALLTMYFIRVMARQNRELRELDHQKNVLVDSLVHDLRQPLTAVISGLSSLTLGDELPRQARDLVAIAQEGASRLLRMVNDLLDVTRVEAGQPLIEAREIPADEFIRRGAEVLAPMAAASKVTLSVIVPPDLPPVWGDSERLSRVVMNLVGNAIRFTKSGGNVSVTASADRARGRLVVSVSDTGIGIPVEQQQRIFQKFARAVDAPSSGRTSTGLGLYFCRLIVEAHGGRIWVESKVGEGATFTFTVPLAKKQTRV